MPKRSRNGVVSSPCRVVAPTSVKIGRQVDPHAARRRPLADDDVERAVLHRRIEHLLDHRIEPVDLVDEEHVVGLEIGQQRLEGHPPWRSPARWSRESRRRVPSPRSAPAWSCRGRAGRRTAHGPSPRRALGGLDEHAQILARALLPDELGARFRPQRGVRRGSSSNARSGEWSEPCVTSASGHSISGSPGRTPPDCKSGSCDLKPVQDGGEEVAACSPTQNGFTV